MDARFMKINLYVEREKYEQLKKILRDKQNGMSVSLWLRQIIQELINKNNKIK